MPPSEKATFPAGAGIPLPLGYVTFAVRRRGCPKVGDAGEELRATVVVAPVTVRLKVWVALCGVPVVESVTLTVNVKDPPTVGVPERVPELDSVSPFGRVDPGASDHVNGAFPPCTWKVHV